MVEVDDATHFSKCMKCMAQCFSGGHRPLYAAGMAAWSRLESPTKPGIYHYRNSGTGEIQSEEEFHRAPPSPWVRSVHSFHHYCNLEAIATAAHGRRHLVHSIV